MSRALRLVASGMRWLIKPLLARNERVGAARFGMWCASLAFVQPFGVRVERNHDGWRLRPQEPGAMTVLYFHGGAYIAGSPWTHRGLLGRIAKAAGAEVVAPAYPLAPEHPAPAAFNTARRAFAALQAEGVAPGRIILAGDSAGGGLAAALADDLAARGIAIAGLILLSPWADLTLSGASITTHAQADPLLHPSRVRAAVDQVRGDLAAHDPRLSPLFGTAPSAQPTLILVGENEILLDDSRRLAVHLRDKGARVDLHIEAHAPHVYPYLAPYVPEARRAIRQIAAFVQSVSPLPPPPADS
jgi:acetyl esterase/lipase